MNMIHLDHTNSITNIHISFLSFGENQIKLWEIFYYLYMLLIFMNNLVISKAYKHQTIRAEWINILRKKAS